MQRTPGAPVLYGCTSMFTGRAYEIANGVRPRDLRADAQTWATAASRSPQRGASMGAGLQYSLIKAIIKVLNDMLSLELHVSRSTRHIILTYGGQSQLSLSELIKPNHQSIRCDGHDHCTYCISLRIITLTLVLSIDAMADGDAPTSLART